MSGQSSVMAGLSSQVELANISQVLDALKAYARPSYSGFRVACVAETNDGQFIPGVNYEFDRHRSICAEQSALVLARNAGVTGLKNLYVSSWPCGLCRQTLYEAAGTDLLIYNSVAGVSKRLEELLPEAFDLPYVRTFWQHDCPQSVWQTHSQELSANALLRLAFENSYAPLTRLASAVVLETTSGERHVGMLLENALLAAALPPLHTALVSLLATRKDPSENSFGHIQTVAYAEIAHAAISYAETNKLILKHLAPQASYKVMEF